VAAELFVDTSAWYPLAVASHPEHRRMAAELTGRVKAGVRIVTTNLIIAESHALLLHRGHAGAALDFVKTVRQRPHLVVFSTPELEASAISDWLERFTDQTFSLTDAVSFAVMKARGIDEALTLDRQFVVAGFRSVA
jgi:predicted nucleic acid-binding protein